MSKSYRSGLERTGADIGTAPAGGDAIFAPVSEEKSAMQGWNTLVVQPPIGEDGELAEPEAPDAPPARPQLPALPADHAAHADDVLLQRLFRRRLHDRPCLFHLFLRLFRILLQEGRLPLKHLLGDRFLFFLTVLLNFLSICKIHRFPSRQSRLIAGTKRTFFTASNPRSALITWLETIVSTSMIA